MEPDYPAAHSMDSCWFGVDRDGRVGFFETGEAGAQPIRGIFSRAAEFARLQIGELVPAGETVVDLRGYLLPYLKNGGMRHTYGGTEWPVLMFIDSLDPVRDALSSGQATEVRARDGAAVLWHGLPDAEYNRLHAGVPELCRGCFWRFDMEEREPAEEGAEPVVNLARHGVYLFKALGGNAAANPYGLQEAPVNPIHVDQLPPRIRTGLKEVQFTGVSFADTPVFQPVEHVSCTAYEPKYVDMAGREHPLANLQDLDLPPEEVNQWLEQMFGPHADDERAP